MTLCDLGHSRASPKKWFSSALSPTSLPVFCHCLPRILPVTRITPNHLLEIFPLAVHLSQHSSCFSATLLISSTSFMSRSTSDSLPSQGLVCLLNALPRHLEPFFTHHCSITSLHVLTASFIIMSGHLLSSFLCFHKCIFMQILQIILRQPRLITVASFFDLFSTFFSANEWSTCVFSTFNFVERGSPSSFELR